MNQKEWEDLKRFHEIETDADLYNFMLQYQRTIHLSLTPNELCVIRAALLQYEPEPWDAASLDRLRKMTNNIEGKT